MTPEAPPALRLNPLHRRRAGREDIAAPAPARRPAPVLPGRGGCTPPVALPPPGPAPSAAARGSERSGDAAVPPPPPWATEVRAGPGGGVREALPALRRRPPSPPPPAHRGGLRRRVSGRGRAGRRRLRAGVAAALQAAVAFLAVRLRRGAGGTAAGGG